MKILVLVKEVPDTYGDRKLNLTTGLAERDASDKVLDEIGERAIEAAVSHAESNPGTEVVVLSVGPDSVPNSLRKGLAMGADKAVHVLDEKMRGADLTLTAEVLAAAAARVGYDLILTGDLSTDGVGGVIPSMLAEHLGLPHVTNLTSLAISGSEVRGTRDSDSGTMTVSAPIPAVVSITDRLPDPRFPNFKGIMAAKKKPFETVTLADLGVDPASEAPRSIIIAISEKPARGAGIKIVDEGDAGNQLADFLVQNRLV
jgi:electron transfer flavoprotein beta subunit